MAVVTNNDPIREKWLSIIEPFERFSHPLLISVIIILSRKIASPPHQPIWTTLKGATDNAAKEAKNGLLLSIIVLHTEYEWHKSTHHHHHRLHSVLSGCVSVQLISEANKLKAYEGGTTTPRTPGEGETLLDKHQCSVTTFAHSAVDGREERAYQREKEPQGFVVVVIMLITSKAPPQLLRTVRGWCFVCQIARFGCEGLCCICQEDISGHCT